MTEGEAPEVSELLCEAYAWLAEREGLPGEQTELLQSIRGSVETVRRESQTETYVVARDESGIIGLVAVAGNVIRKLYVRPSRHGTGVGRALYEEAESLIRLGGHGKVTLGAFPSAVPFYEAMGLRAVSVKESRGPLAGLRITLMEKRLES